MVERLIQSNYKFARDSPGNFELVYHLQNGQLLHRYRDNSAPGTPWSPPTATITSNAISAGSIIQSKPGTPGSNGGLEVIVVEKNPSNPDRGNLVRYYRATVDSSWAGPELITQNATGPGSIVQSTYGNPEAGNFEVVVQEGKDNLVHYFRNNSSTEQPWSGPTATITSNANGSASIIQSKPDTPGSNGGLEVVVLEGNGNLNRYYRPSPTDFWHGPENIVSDAEGPGSLIQSTYETPPGNFEVIFPRGSSLIHYYRDNIREPTLPWKPSNPPFAPGTTAPGSLIQSTYQVPNNPSNFEAVVIEVKDLNHYTRNNGVAAQTWTKDETITTV
ncbi:hypothetical protein N7471_008606 [Penicillium samsonianum]|uniref:uncharacterized protein n=1 Tax=Penicillium samsonianum TaxID=1882272 RepID=UPI002549908A|nr:uncharacterized protein N7471_008606 [Penicillium samsonianum]KAJ6133391.1 hypothetical protein N7471_008606 [Penicillium samsonianum]